MHIHKIKPTKCGKDSLSTKLNPSKISHYTALLQTKAIAATSYIHVYSLSSTMFVDDHNF